MVHDDCMHLFRQRASSKAALDCLWRVAFWRKPWRAAPPLFLPEAINVGPESLAAVSLHCSIPKLAELPYEIVEEIYQHSSSAIFWRTAAAIELGKSIKTSLEHGSTPDNFSVSVRDVFAWERGGALVAHHNQSMLPIIRVMIDSRGVKKVERLANTDHWDLERYDQYAFVLEHESKFENVNLHIKVNKYARIIPRSSFVLHPIGRSRSASIPRRRWASHMGYTKPAQEPDPLHTMHGSLGARVCILWRASAASKPVQNHQT